MWKAVFAVVMISTSVMAEPAPTNHGDPAFVAQQQQQQVTETRDNSSSLFLKLNSCLAQRPGTGGSIDELLKKASTR